MIACLIFNLVRGISEEVTTNLINTKKEISMKRIYISDLLLAKEVHSGNTESVERFYGKYADALFAYIYHHTNNCSDYTEDIWQESLLAIFKAIDKYRGKSSLFTWMCGIAKRKIADFYRKKENHLDIAGAPNDYSNRELINTQSDFFEDEFIQQQGRVTVIETLMSLNENYRQVLIEKYVEGLSIKDIAKKSKRTSKSVESLLGRAKKAFRQSYEKLLERNE